MPELKYKYEVDTVVYYFESANGHTFLPSVQDAVVKSATVSKIRDESGAKKHVTIKNYTITTERQGDKVGIKEEKLFATKAEALRLLAEWYAAKLAETKVLIGRANVQGG